MCTATISYNWLKGTLLLVLSSSLINVGYAKECTFRSKVSIEKRYQESPWIEKYTWHEQSKTVKAITTEGDVLSVKHWVCHHYGLEATLYTGPYAELDDHSISKQLKKLADIVLSPKDYELFAGNLQQMKLTIPDEGVTKQLQNHPYQEFSFQYQIVSEGLLVSIRRIGE